MRNYLIAFFVLMAACAFGANVTFKSFNTNQFNANAAANSVSLNSAGTNIVDSTDLVLNTIYTNSSGSNLLVTVGLVTTPGATAGSGALEINQSPTNNFPFITSLNVYVAIGGSSGINQESVSGFVQPGGVYVATNLQGIVSILANSCQRVYSPIGGGVGPPGPGISGTVQSGVIFSNSQFAGSQNFSTATVVGLVPTNSTYYVNTNGNDTISVFGNPLLPAQHFKYALANTPANGVIDLAAGQVFGVTNTLTWPNPVVINMEAGAVLQLQSPSGNISDATPANMFTLNGSATNLEIFGGKIDCGLVFTNSGWIFDTTGGNCLIKIHGTKMWSPFDGFHQTGTDGSLLLKQFYCDSGFEIHCLWDFTYKFCTALASNACIISLMNGSIYTETNMGGITYTTPSPIRIAARGTVTLQNCHIYDADGTGGTASFMSTQGGTINIINCYETYSGASAAPILINTFSGGGVMNITGYYIPTNEIAASVYSAVTFNGYQTLPSQIPSVPGLGAVTVGGSPFTFINTSGSRLECYLSAGSGTLSVTKNGTSIYGSLSAADVYVLLQTNSNMVVTYSTATPTIVTNAW